jgi:hypothetical protein
LIINAGTLDINQTYSVSYDINNGNQVFNEAVNIPILTIDSLIFTFSQKGAFSTVGTYLLKV